MYKKLGIQIFQVLGLKFHIPYKYANEKRLRYYDFRLQVIAYLLSAKPSPPRKFPLTASTNRRSRKRCQNCARQNIRKDTMYFQSGYVNFPLLCILFCSFIISSFYCLLCSTASGHFFTNLQKITHSLTIFISNESVKPYTIFLNVIKCKIRLFSCFQLFYLILFSFGCFI